jgi:hypothetical protein
MRIKKSSVLATIATTTPASPAGVPGEATAGVAGAGPRRLGSRVELGRLGPLGRLRSLIKNHPLAVGGDFHSVIPPHWSSAAGFKSALVTCQAG